MAGSRDKRLPHPQRSAAVTSPDTPTKSGRFRRSQGNSMPIETPPRGGGIQMDKALPRQSQVQPIYYISRSSTQTYVPLIATDEFPAGVNLTLDSNTADKTTGPPVFLGEYSHSGSRFCLDLKAEQMKDAEILELFSSLVAKMDKDQLLRVLSEHGFDLEQRQARRFINTTAQPIINVSNEDHMFLQDEQHRRARPSSNLGSNFESRGSPIRESQQESQYLQTREFQSPKVEHTRQSSRGFIQAPDRSKPKTGKGSRNTAAAVHPFVDRKISTRFPSPGDNKKWCSYWIQKGECAYTQQGCKYLHEMPDLSILKSIGFTHVPFWYKQSQEREQRIADSRTNKNITNINQNGIPKGPFTMPPRPTNSPKMIALPKRAKEIFKSTIRLGTESINLMDMEDYDTSVAVSSQYQTSVNTILPKTKPPSSSRPTSAKSGPVYEDENINRGGAKTEGQSLLNSTKEPNSGSSMTTGLEQPHNHHFV